MMSFKCRQYGLVLLALMASSRWASAQTATPAVVPQPPVTPSGAEAAQSAPVATSDAPASASSAATTEAVPRVQPPAEVAAAAAKLEALKIGGGGILWFYQPTEKGQKNNVEFYNIRLTFDANFGDGFAFHLEPRIRDTKLRSFFGGTAWVQEGYASYTYGAHTFKLGKVYSQLGLFWDNSFWGNVQVYDGLKLAPDYGGSLEGKFELNPSYGLGYAAQFFVVDGTTNVSLPGRDTLSIPDSRRRNEVVLRVDPYAKFGKNGRARLGLSGQRLTADSPGIPEADRDVLRYGVDFKVTTGGLGVWGEYLHQKGQTVTDHPIAGTPAVGTVDAVPGRASKNIDYYEVGAEYTYGRVTARYNFSAAKYWGVGVKEWLHVPALALKVNEHLSFGAEYVHWSRSGAGVSEKYNRSLNLLLYFDF
ncbi:MAG: hypothetical protein ABIQ16_27640 [Polyangiaceae bacterium]